MEEMMQHMMPADMSDEMHEKMMEQFRMKLAPGLQEGEIPGSLQQAMKKMMPDMQMMPETTAPGATPQKMVDAMMAGWVKKWGGHTDVAPWPMDADPEMPSFPKQIKQEGWKPIRIQNQTRFKP